VIICTPPADPLRSLEIVAEDRTSTVWDEQFPSDEAALAEALRAIKEDGIRSFSEGEPDDTRQ
jgi:uncharacterized protein